MTTVNASDPTATGTITTVPGISSRSAWVLRSLCATGLVISGYLAWTALQMQPVYGCGSGEIVDCGHVLNSRWSKVLGIPVSLPAAGLYATLLSLLFFVSRPTPVVFHRWLWSGLTTGFVAAGLVAFWFMGLQIFALQHICPYCIAVHTCGLILAGTALLSPRISSAIRRQSAGYGLIAASLLIVSQLLTKQEPTFQIVVPDYVTPAAGSLETSEFSAPDAEFAAPSEEFSAPGDEFAAPEADSAVPADEFAAPTIDSFGSADQVSSKAPDLSATLLMLSPFRNALWHSPLVMLTSTPDEKTPETTDSQNVVQIVAASDDTAVAASQPSASASEPTLPTPAAAADNTVPANTTSTEPNTNTQSPTQPTDPATVVTPATKPAPRKITVAGVSGPITLDVRAWPLLGSADARYVFVEMFDYTCPHCRETHKAIRGALQQFGEDVAVIALPVPLERACNRAATGSGHAGACQLGRLAVAVWRCQPDKYEEFHDWMFAENRSTAAAQAHAEKLVGAQALKKELESGVPAKYIARHVDLYVKVGSGSVPKMMFSASAVNGQVQKDWLCSMISREMEKAQPK